MRKRILFLAYGGTGWIGGLYYIKNAMVTLMQSPVFVKKWEVVVVTEPENSSLFDEFYGQIILETIKPKNSIDKRLFHAKLIFKYGIIKIYPIAADCRFWSLPVPLCNWFVEHEICWIPDFQHLYLPEFFSKEECMKRDAAYKTVAERCKIVILSSYSAQKDFIEHYGADINKTAVLSFVSAIGKEVAQITDSYCTEVLARYGLDQKKYIYIPNQFWQHKNHMTVLKMIQKAKQSHKLEGYTFVFTGNLNDERNKEHIDKLMKFISENYLQQDLKILGFIERLEQLTIMKKAEMIIQPSLFEGWGTVLEDCKVLGKVVVLSDLPIHREQMNANCVLFSKLDEDDLLSKVIIAQSKEANMEISGILDTMERAAQYSVPFVTILEGGLYQ